MKFRVWLRSKPGMWATYDGYVDVTVDSQDDAFAAAVRELRAKSFPDRSLDAWTLDKIEAR